VNGAWERVADQRLGASINSPVANLAPERPRTATRTQDEDFKEHRLVCDAGEVHLAIALKILDSENG
jgi:hypothetical protein